MNEFLAGIRVLYPACRMEIRERENGEYFLVLVGPNGDAIDSYALNMFEMKGDERND